MPAPANTRSAARRTLRFETFNDIRRDLDAIEAAHRAGRLTTTGNWTPGQNLGHLAAFINYAYDGYPAQLGHPPWLVRFVVGLFKKKFIHGKHSPGVKIPRVPGGTVGVENLTTEEGLARLRTALTRMEQITPPKPNPLFGPLTHTEWMALQCRHCELHLGFLQPSDVA